MSTKDDLNSGVKKTVKDVRDATREVLHRSTADAERSRRELAGDSMTTGAKVTSGVNEAKHRVQAEVDRTKRKVRDAE